MFQSADELLAYVKDEDVETIDVRFCDLPGVMQHFTVPAGSFGPEVFEDGGQMRDFVHVSDVARCNELAIRRVLDEPDGTVSTYNVCSGEPVSIERVAGLVARGTGSDLTPVVSGRYRLGDVRHIVASPDRAARPRSACTAATASPPISPPTRPTPTSLPEATRPGWTRPTS